MQPSRGDKVNMLARKMAEKTVHAKEASPLFLLFADTTTTTHPAPATDILSTLPDDLLVRITAFLDASSLLQLRVLNRTFQRVCHWDAQCQALWLDKIHVCPQAQAHPNRCLAYRMSKMDAKNRNYMHRNELLFNVETNTGTIWKFRFKKSAGTDWTTLDPWYQGKKPRQFVFLENGIVKQYIESSNEEDTKDDKTPGTPLSSVSTTTTATPQLIHPVFNLPREQQQQTLLSPTSTITDPPMPMTWRFLTHPMDLPLRPVGSYIRLTVGGRDVPTYSIRRSPTGNWGFVMESCWGLYTSFDLPPKPAISATDQQRKRRRIIPRRIEDGNTMWIEEEDDDDNDDTNEETDAAEERRNSATQQNMMMTQQGIRELQDDSLLLITNDRQWREAFLYNVGARVLPEGDEAADEFDRAWGAL